MKVSLEKGLSILFLLASHRFGLSREEICDQVGIGRVTFFQYMKALQNAGVFITSQKEPDRYSWHKLYKLQSVCGTEFRLKTRFMLMGRM